MLFEVRKYFRWSRTFIIIKQKKTLDVLDELWGGIESVPEKFPTYFCIIHDVTLSQNKNL